MDKKTVSYYNKNAEFISSRYESVESPLKQFISEIIKPGYSVLDIGCGSGRDLTFLNEKGCSVTGIDPSEELLAEAKKQHPELAEKLYKGSLPDDLKAITNNKFDVILLSAVIMHLNDKSLKDSVGELKKNLNENGLIVISHCISRQSLDKKNRESNGRLFIIRTSEQVENLLKEAGLTLLKKITRKDSLQREGIIWETLFFARK